MHAGKQYDVQKAAFGAQISHNINCINVSDFYFTQLLVVST